MGYVDRKDAGINPKKRLILTAGHLKDYLKQIESEHKFYELEMAEVVEVHLDETKSSFPKRPDGTPNYAYYGGILAISVGLITLGIAFLALLERRWGRSAFEN